MKLISDIMKCLVCDSTDVKVGPPVGPHFGSIRCMNCGVFRWLSKRDAERAIHQVEKNANPS